MFATSREPSVVGYRLPAGSEARNSAQNSKRVRQFRCIGDGSFVSASSSVSIHNNRFASTTDEPSPAHLPVLLDEVMAALAPHPGGVYLDGTVGLGGHAERVLELAAPDGRLIGLDKDPEALEVAAARLAGFGDRVRLVHGGYEDAPRFLREQAAGPLDGLLLDLGLSSLQLDGHRRGFSFRRSGPIDMRFDPTSAAPSAADLLNTYSEDELADLIWQFGEERSSRRIARAIARARPFADTAALAAAVERASGYPNPVHRSAAAARTFQALRIAVNGELSNVEAFLAASAALLRPGGRLVVISFHSLEDRIVKQFLQRESRDCLCPPKLPECRCAHQRSFKLLARTATRPGASELHDNPRSRSALMRAAVRI
jgi:16S rRNA (cytosine1402-N4)-methyltransferase